MADVKKKDDKKSSTGPGRTPAQELTFLLGGLFILAIILGQISLYLNSIGWGNFTNVWNYFLHSYLYPLWSKWKVISVLFSAIAVTWLVYSHKKMKEVEDEEEKMYGHVEEDSLLESIQSEKEKNEKWERVKGYANSENPADWRLAIIEADVMLEEVLKVNGFPGDTIGDMLKAAEGGGLASLNAAWDAHKVRNRITHSGSDFQLSERETRRVVARFEEVFNEFGAI